MDEIKQLVSKDKKIGVLYGGMSNERDVSLRSGKNCFEALLRLGYENVELIDVDKNIAQNLVENEIEIAYIALHGKYGEDGCIQGLLEILGIAYTGCGPTSSAVCMDKQITKQIVQNLDIPLIKSVSVGNCDDLDEAVEDLKFPLMVKPLTEGSSIGMSKVEEKSELKNAVCDALKCSKAVMLEEFLQGVSTTVGVLDCADKTFATPVLEFRTKTEWYDFEAKYTQGMTEFILPAQLSEGMTELLQKLAVETHSAVKATGMSRVDFLICDNVPYLLEVNTIPGMTDLSDLPAQAQEMGISYDNLVQIILNSALLNKN